MVRPHPTLLKKHLLTIVKLCGLSIGLTMAGLLVAVVMYRWVPVTDTYFMHHMCEKVDAKEINQQWVSLDEISDELATAVVSAEDNRFSKHWGIDWDAVNKARQYNTKGRRTHGASTISQQTAKNVFLWNDRSWLRKGCEVVVTLMIEALWGKRRIMEVYLNVVEFGPGVFGAEAAAKTYFKKSAKELTRSEAALMVVVLPNPIKMKIAKPSEYVRKRQSQIMALMPKIGKVKY